jgi:chemotaxis protein CheD
MADDFRTRRRTETEKHQSGDYFSGKDRYYDQMSEETVVKVFSGDCYSTDQPGEVLVTVLGSCIACCMRDPITKVGGMNHFLLPDGSNAHEAPNRYGAYSMEQLINDILKKGAVKSRLEVKVFGGGNVIKSSAMIGDKNVNFIRDYLKQEGLRIAQEDLGGTSPRRIHYYPETGRVMMRKLRRDDDLKQVEKEELKYRKKIITTADKGNEGEVELF